VSHKILEKCDGIVNRLLWEDEHGEAVLLDITPLILITPAVGTNFMVATNCKHME